MRVLAWIRVASCFGLAACLGGCSRSEAPKDIAAITSEYVYAALALSPVTATGQGYHQHRGVPLDELLDDYSTAGIAAQHRIIKDYEARLNGLDVNKMDPEQQADLEILRNNIALSLLEMDTIQSYKHNPTLYVELIGNALFTPYMLEYAPLEQRSRHIIRRMEKIGSLLEQAKVNLTDAPEVWTRVALEENAGNIELIDKTLRAATPAADKALFDNAAKQAIEALKNFNTFLKDTLSKKTTDWRLGKDKYGQKFRYTLSVRQTPEQLMDAAQVDLKRVRSEMAKLAAPLTVEQALAAVAKQHPTPETYMAKAKETLAQATSFVKEKDLLTLPARGNLQVIETPEFIRGIYAVGGFNPAPPLEPKLGAFYWITPIPAGWSKDRVESKLREYNDFGLQQLTIHEAMPGHYVQLEYANDVQPVTRRLLRNIFANGPYVEGWAVYTQQVMDEAGYLNHDKGLQLTFYKQILRVLANTILDVGLHTAGMTEQQALDLMIKDTYQEKEEATAKLQRAQLSSCQLPTYYAGWKGWLEVRDHYRERRGTEFSLKEFHERALKESGVPLPVLDRLLR